MPIFFSSEITENQYKRQVKNFSPTDFYSPNLVSLIYYPYQFIPIPHVELEVQGKCYSFFWCCRKLTNLNHKIINTKIYPLGIRPFVRIGIMVSPKQQKKLKIEITKARFNINCIKAISDLLNECADLNIPFPLSISPTFSAGYLLVNKTLGSSRITSINCYPSSSSLKFCDPTVVKIYKIWTYTYSCLSIAAELFLLYNIPKIAYENSQIIQLIRLWAAGQLS
jgi:hypothetical protein